ncbi:MAG: hypothetical protein V1928_00210 [Parcubacteria group bacterium]
MDFLAWENVGYLGTFILGIMFLIMSMMGIGGDHDADVSADHDIGHDASHDADHNADHDAPHKIDYIAEHGAGAHHTATANESGAGIIHFLLNLLGVGRCPLSIIMMTFLLLFALVGVCSNIILKNILVTPYIYGPISYVGAFFASFTLTGSLARLIGRWMPSSRTSILSTDDMLGSIATITYISKDGKTGRAVFYDKNNTVHQADIEIKEGQSFKEDDQVLLMECDEKKITYQVETAPTEVTTKK